MKFILLIFLTLTFSSCSNTSLQYLDAKEFIKKCEKIEDLNSAIRYSYVGTGNSRIYLEFEDYITSSSSPKTIIYWTELKNLSDKEREKIKSYRKENITASIKQSIPFKNILNAIQTKDKNKFKNAYSKKIQESKEQNNWDKNFSDASKSIIANFAEIIDKSFKYKYNSKENKLGIFYKDKEVVWLKVIHEFGEWKLDER